MATNGNDIFLLQRAREAGITDPRELGNFMGQMQVESGGFHSMTENTQYSASRLLKVFGPYTDKHGHWHDGRNGLTTLSEAEAVVAGGREGIANAIYGGAWGARNLGNTEPGDGWRFRGRGYVQLTGRDHYEQMGQKLGLDLVGHPELAADREVAARIAILYWNERVRSQGHQFDVVRATRDINGGANGLRDRIDAAESWQRTLAHTAPEQANSAHSQTRVPEHRASHLHPAARSHAMADGALTSGESSPEVRALQTALDRLGYTDAANRPVARDGHFGRHTLEALQAFQRDHGLNGKGVDGPRTQRALHEAGAALVTSPTHPHHALFEQTLRKVEEAERARGIALGPHSERIAAALTTELVREGITRIDRVEFNRDGSLVRAVQAGAMRDEPGLNRSTDPISTRQASVQTVAESSRQTHEVAVNVQAQRADPQFAHVSPGRSPAPAH